MEKNDIVKHAKYGVGTVLLVNDDLVVVSFGEGDQLNLQQVPLSSLQKIESVESQVGKPRTRIENQMALARIQAKIIEYVNNSWGVFSRSSIDLLPHQLWVCRQILSKWPSSYLIADDVGLGKTIEAGLIMSSLCSTGRAKRILILTPPKLVGQWKDRLKKMFDLIFFAYSRDMEEHNPDFFTQVPLVIASFTTLQIDNGFTHEHLLEAPPYDLVVVDEAHHMNAEENQKTLQFKLFEKLKNFGKIKSALLFTGTPHRGKNFGFWSLMSLVNPDVFGPKKDPDDQYAALKDYFIRNNKQNVVNMKGEKLFTTMTQHPYEFSYTLEEAAFYKSLTEFIVTGQMYAKTLGNGGNAVGLLLTSLQKIASSSIAAIASALANRRKTLEGKEADLAEYNPDEKDPEEQIPTQDVLKLMENEAEKIDELLQLAADVKAETKIEKIISIIKEQYPDEQVLLFTEYKRTQALMMSRLMEEWGPKCVTIINGDEALRNVKFPDGSLQNVEVPRNCACELFNDGEKRFLISTEAAGEGIDLQKNCHILIHIDLPWNPMRLHQRVGRVHRLGQTKDVEVISVRNTDNIETKIWTYLEDKIASIQKAFSATMDDPDDMMQLVLGMQSSDFYDNLFKGSFEFAKDAVDKWFDPNSKTFGGSSAVDVAGKLGLNAARFNLVGLDDIPKLDLPDLVPFFGNVLSGKGVRLKAGEKPDTYDFRIPDDWEDYGNEDSKRGVIFRRELNPGESQTDVVGLGNHNVDCAMKDALLYTILSSSVQGKKSYFVYTVSGFMVDDPERQGISLLTIAYDEAAQKAELMPLDTFYKEISKLQFAKESSVNRTKIPDDVMTLAAAESTKQNFNKPKLELYGVVSGEVSQP